MSSNVQNAYFEPKVAQTDNERRKSLKSAAIDDPQHVRIDSSPLHCPVCLSVFLNVPEILPCGHSFCKSCLDRVSSNVHLVRNRGQQPFFECPLCRRSCPVSRNKVPNYAVDAILESIEIPNSENDHFLMGDLIAGKEIRIKRLEETISRLETEVSRANHKVAQKDRELILQKRLILALAILLIFGVCAKIIQMFLSLCYLES